jgi:hypothetical protein
MKTINNLLYTPRNGLRPNPWILRNRSKIETAGLVLGAGLCVVLLAGFWLRKPAPAPVPTPVPVEDLYAQWFASQRVRMALEQSLRVHPTAQAQIDLTREIERERRLKAAIEEARP